MLKPSDNPPIKPESVDSVAAITADWWVAHTKPRSEKALAWDLIEADISYFLPMSQRTAYWGGRKRQVMTPLFPSYVFYNGDRSTVQRVAATGRVVQTIPVHQQQQFVSELAAIETVLKCSKQLDLYPFATIGRRCRVRQGPMMGIEGVIIQNENVTRLVLQVSMLGQGAALEINPSLLEPLDG